MTEMIERVAAAMCEYDSCTLTPTDTWNRGMARAVIEAMREPAKNMAAAGYEVSHGSYEDEGAIVWRAMIDAALETKEPDPISEAGQV